MNPSIDVYGERGAIVMREPVQGNFSFFTVRASDWGTAPLTLVNETACTNSPASCHVTVGAYNFPLGYLPFPLTPGKHAILTLGGLHEDVTVARATRRMPAPVDPDSVEVKVNGPRSGFSIYSPAIRMVSNGCFEYCENFGVVVMSHTTRPVSAQTLEQIGESLRRPQAPCPPAGKSFPYLDPPELLDEDLSNWGPYNVSIRAFGGDLARFQWDLVDWHGHEVASSVQQQFHYALDEPGVYFLRVEGFDQAGCLRGINAIRFGLSLARDTYMDCDSLVVANVSGSCPRWTVSVPAGTIKLQVIAEAYDRTTGQPMNWNAAFELRDAAGKIVNRTTHPYDCCNYALYNRLLAAFDYGNWTLSYLPANAANVRIYYNVLDETDDWSVPWPVFPDGWSHG